MVGVSGVTVGTSLSLAAVGTSIGVLIAGCTFFTSVTTRITNEYFSKLKLRYTKLKTWIKKIAIVCDKTFTKSMVDLKNEEKQGEE